MPAPTSAPAPAPAPGTGPAESHLGLIRFTPPPGWLSADDPAKDARLLYPPDKSAAIVVLLTKPGPEPFDFRKRFDQAVENTAGGQRLTERGEVKAGTSRQGYDTLSEEFAFDDASGDTDHGRLVAARIGDRLAAFWYLATGRDRYRKHQEDMDRLLNSVTFEAGGTAGAAGPAPPGTPTTAPANPPASPATHPAGPGGAPASPSTNPATLPEVQAIEREKDELRRRLAQLETKERQLGAAFGPVGTSPAAPAASAAQAGTRPADAAGTAGALDVIDRGRPGALLRDRYPKRTKLLLTLTPTDTGGAGGSETRSLTCGIDALAEGTHFNWLPPAPFKLTAKAVTPDAREWPLKLTTRTAPAAGDWSDSVEVDLRSSPALGVTDVPK